MFVERETGGWAGHHHWRWRERFDGRSPRSSGPPGSAPVRPATRRPAPPGQDRQGARPGALALGQSRQARPAGRGPAGGGRGRWHFRLPLVDGRPLRRIDRRRLCERPHRDARRQGGGIPVERHGRRQRAGERRRRDRHHRRRRLTGSPANAARDKVATQQATVERIGRQIAAQEAASRRRTRSSPWPRRARPATSWSSSVNIPGQREFASRQTLEQAQANRDQAVAARAKRGGRRRRCRSERGRAEGAAAGRREDLEEFRTASPRPIATCRSPWSAPLRWHHRQSRGADRGFRADRPAAREPGSPRRSLRRRQLQGDAAPHLRPGQ